jgi:hypothetical protein
MTLDVASPSARSRTATGQPSPSPRAGAAVCYNGEKVLLFGGDDGDIRGDTWVFDTTNGWVELTPDPDHRPSPRAYAGLAYDGIAKRAILFGGRGKGGAYYADTWAFDTSTGKWEPVDAVNPPPARSSFGMAFDGKYIVLCGGIRDGFAVGGTFIFHGKAWEEISYSSEPGPRASPAMSMDIDGEQAMLFGGSKDPAPYSDTWFYTSTNPPGWTNFVPATSPPLRERAAMVEGSFLTNWQFVMFGGYRSYDKTYYCDTWGYYDDEAGGNWQLVDTPKPPPPRADHGMALVTGSGIVVLFGGRNASGFLGDTWIYDTGWTPWTPPQR